MKRLMLFALMFCALGCPSWQRPACPTPGAYRCEGDVPEYCAPSQQWTRGGDEPCARQGRVCAIDTDGTAYCAAQNGASR